MGSPPPEQRLKMDYQRNSADNADGTMISGVLVLKGISVGSRSGE